MSTMGLIGRFRQQPSENRRYFVNYAAALQEAETVTNVVTVIDTVTVPPLAISNVTIAADGKSVTLFVGGGLDGNVYKVTLRVTTSSGQVFEDEVEYIVEEK